MRFNAEAPIIGRFRDIFDFTKHTPVPADWFVLLSDIRGSTKAIESGHYKDVNVIGASSIIAVLNATGDRDIPYTFGGDGATFLIPPDLKEKACRALLATRQLARASFDMELRIGVVPIYELYAKGFQLKMAKYRLSEHFTQAVLSGNGFIAAENLVKDPERGKAYRIDETGNPIGNYNGLECRWLPVENRNGEVVSLIVMSALQNPDEGQKCYREVIENIEEIYGSKDNYHPVAENRLKLSSKMSDYIAESKVRTFPENNRILYLVITYFITLVVGRAWKWFGLSFGKQYKKDLVANSDYRKFDGVLRMVLDGNTQQRERLQLFLERKFQQNELVYGIHKSDNALVTCLVFDRHGKHIHFVDGGNGGYAQAAKNMKARLKKNNLA